MRLHVSVFSLLKIWKIFLSTQVFILCSPDKINNFLNIFYVFSSMTKGAPFLKPFLKRKKLAFLRFSIVLKSVIGKTHQKVFVFGCKRGGEDGA